MRSSIATFQTHTKRLYGSTKKARVNSTHKIPTKSEAENWTARDVLAIRAEIANCLRIAGCADSESLNIALEARAYGLERLVHSWEKKVQINTGDK